MLCINKRLYRSNRPDRSGRPNRSNGSSRSNRSNRSNRPNRSDRNFRDSQQYERDQLDGRHNNSYSGRNSRTAAGFPGIRRIYDNCSKYNIYRTGNRNLYGFLQSIDDGSAAVINEGAAQRNAPGRIYLHTGLIGQLFCSNYLRCLDGRRYAYTPAFWSGGGSRPTVRQRCHTYRNTACISDVMSQIKPVHSGKDTR